MDAPRIDDLEGIRALRTALERAGYTSEALEERLMLDGPFSRDPTETPVYLRLLPAGEAFSAVTKLFLIGVPVAREEVARAFEPLTVERLEAMGLVRMSAGDVEPKVGILPWSDFFIVSDPLENELPPTRPDYVLNLIPPSVALAKLVPRRPIDAALDIGVGSGVQSLLAAEHTGRVLAVDVNARALDYARFNLVLNALQNVECREGSVFDPVAGETFDLIVSNPPYVISPETYYAFRDSGLSGDSFCEGLVRESPRYLREGGLAVMLVSWVHGKEEEWTAPVRRWVEGTGCDALLLHYLTQDPLGYAATWNRPLRWDPVAYENALERWIDYDRKLGIELIAWGAIVLRKRKASENWFYAHAVASGAIDVAGEHLERMVAAYDVLGASGDGEELLQRRLRLADDHRLEQTLVLSEGKGRVSRAVLRLEGGFNFQVELNGHALQLVAQLDGRPVQEVLHEIAESVDQEARDELLGSALPMLSELYGLGFLIPADDEGAS